MRNLALADLNENDLDAMLAENETLFVEHKGRLGPESYSIAKAICSFANTLGGWVLIGVTNACPNAGDAVGWEPVRSYELTDRVRQLLASARADPIPPFAATVLTHRGTNRRIGIVRVYESTDTPHVMGNGQVFVRSVAEDSQLTRRYRPGGVDTQAVLLALADRGRDGASRALRKLDPAVAPLGALGAGITVVWGSGIMSGARLAIRAIPITGHRLADFAVSESGREAAESAARVLARRSADDIPLDPPQPHASGMVVEARSADLLVGSPGRSGIASITMDAAGVVTAAINFGSTSPAPPVVELRLEAVRELLIEPLVTAVVTVMEAAEAYGRAVLEFRVGQLQSAIQLDDGGETRPISGAPIGAEIQLPIAQDRADLLAVSEQLQLDIGRASGLLTFRSRRNVRDDT